MFAGKFWAENLEQFTLAAFSPVPEYAQFADMVEDCKEVSESHHERSEWCIMSKKKASSRSPELQDLYFVES